MKTVHVVENKRRWTWQNRQVLVRWLHIVLGISIQNGSRNTFYLVYSTITSTLRLFADVPYFFQKQIGVLYTVYL